MRVFPLFVGEHSIHHIEFVTGRHGKKRRKGLRAQVNRGELLFRDAIKKDEETRPKGRFFCVFDFVRVSFFTQENNKKIKFVF